MKTTDMFNVSLSGAGTGWVRSMKRVCVWRALMTVCVAGLAIGTAPAQTQILPTITTVAGTKGTKGNNVNTGGPGNGGPATSARFSDTVASATTDPYGNIFVADAGNKVVRRVDALTGNIAIFAGTSGSVCANATNTAGDGCPATQALLVTPVHVRWFRGDLYIVDSGDHRVRKVSGTTGTITTVLGTGVSASVTYGLPGPQTIVRAPQAVAFNSRGDMFVTQNGGAPRVDRVDAVTGLVNSFAGNGTGAKGGDGGVSSSANLNTPIGIAIDSHDNVYIAEKSNNDIRKVTVTDASATNGIISTWAGPQGTATTSGFAGDGSTADNALFSASGLNHISFDANDTLYVADANNFRIRKITQPASGQAFGIITTAAGNGTSTGTTGNDGQYAQNGILVGPNDVQVMPAGDLLITDKLLFAIRMVRPTSVFAATNIGATTAQTIWAQTLGSGTFTIPGSTDFTVGATTCATSGVIAGNVCSATVTMQPSLSGLRTAGVVFTDSSSAVVRQAVSGIGMAPAASVLPGIISLVAGSSTAVAGSMGDGAAATASLLNAPGSVAVDNQGNVYVADTANNTVRKITIGGNISRVAGTAGSAGYSGDGGLATAAKLNAPAGIALDGGNNLYIADTRNNVIRRVDADSGLITTVAGTGTAGYAGDFAAATLATLRAPSAVAFYAPGLLYIADTGNNVVRMVGLRGGAIQTVAGTGVQGSGGDGALALSAQLNAPAGVAVSPTGSVYISDTGNQRIRVLDNSGTISAVAGSGVAGFNGDGAAATASFSAPAGIAVDAAGNVYVADAGNNRVRVVANGQVLTVTGSNTAGVGGNGGNSSLASVNAPTGVALDASGNLLIADTGNNEVRRIDASGSAMAFAPTTPTLSSQAQQVSVINAGNANLNVTSVVIPAGFVQETTGGTDCGTLTLAAGKTCALRIHFAPTALVQYTGNAVITDNSQGVAGATQKVALSGLGKNVFTFSFTLPATVTAGQSISVTVTVSNPAQTYAGTVHFSSSDAQAALPADYTYTAADTGGAHTFTVKLGTAGLQTVTVSDKNDATQFGTQSTTVSAGAASAIVVNSGTNQSANIGTNFGSPLVARVTDSYGNPVAGVTVTFTAPTTGARAAFGGTSATATAVSAVTGLASSGSATLKANFIVGSYNVVASATGLSSASFAMTNTSTVPADFTMTSSLPAIATVLPGASGSVTLTVTPVGGLYAPVNLTCNSPEASITCSFSNATVAPADGTSQTVTFTVQTTGPKRTAMNNVVRTLPTVALAMLMFAGCTRRRSRGLHRLLLALCVVSLGFAVIGCGDGVAKKTPTATYNITVTGTSGSITHTLTIPTAVAE